MSLESERKQNTGRENNFERMASINMFARKSKRDSTNDEPTSSSDDENERIVDATDGNPGWADSIANVLNTTKPKTKKTLVLSKAKNMANIKKEAPPYEFEIDGEIRGDKPEKDAIVHGGEDTKKTKPKLLALRVKPNISDLERERALKKIATRGVVQLFNAVRAQQKDLEDKLKQEKLDHKKDAVLNNINRRKFLDVLMSGDRAKSELVDNFVKKEDLKDENGDDAAEKDVSQWSALRDDFMTGKKYVNWDQEDSDANDQGSERSSSSDSE